MGPLAQRSQTDASWGARPSSVGGNVTETIARVLERAGRGVGGARLRSDVVSGEVLRVRVSTRLTRAIGMEAAAYLVGSVLIDSGFVHVLEKVVRFFADRRLEAICLTHHHEDHSGTCGVLAKTHGCPVYLRNSARRFEEGLDHLKPYRRLWWGEPAPYRPAEMPDEIAAGGRVLRAVPMPGHSATHTAFYDEATGIVFAGDLFITGGATAVMSHENPFDSATSLRRVASLSPQWMFTGHGRAEKAPAALLVRKADAIDQAARQVLSLHAKGVPEGEIARRVFPRGRAGDLAIAAITGGEFSRACFVRACLGHAP